MFVSFVDNVTPRTNMKHRQSSVSQDMPPGTLMIHLKILLLKLYLRTYLNDFWCPYSRYKKKILSTKELKKNPTLICININFLLL